MLVIGVLFFDFLLFTFQNVQVAFFCDNFLREVYLINKSTQAQEKIATGWEGFWKAPYYFDLKAAPGDLIKFKCYNYDGWSFGAGCFFINNICRCYMFENDIKEYSNKISPYSGTANFGNNQCNINIYYLKEFNIVKDYYYQHYIPLDVNGITCKNEFILTIPYDKKYTLKISDFIEANFELKNLEISIIENYKYFSLNNNKLQQNNKFKILNNLLFYSKDKIKIKITFKNYGILLDNTKTCAFNIRVCHERCLDCYDLDVKESNYQCKICNNGLYFVENTNNCMSKEEMEGTNYYFDEEKSLFIKCYNNCLTCFGRGDINDMKCNSCINKKYLAEPNNYIDDITNYYYSEEDKKFKKCYFTCYSCYDKSNKSEQNCEKCIDSYHFIYNEKGKCISENEKPSNTYLNLETNTFELCYDRCEKCDGFPECKECLKDESNNFIYHFVYNEKGKCISENEKPSNTYLNLETNTFELCYDRCEKCDGFPECKECLKDESNNYIYHFIYNEKGKCIKEK